MKRETIEEAVQTLVNGNHSDFGKFVKKASKLDLLEAIEIYSGNVGSRHIIINQMRHHLER